MSDSMTKASLPMEPAAIRWADKIAYPATGMHRNTLLEDDHCQYLLMSMAAGMEIAEHSAPRNASLHVIEGKGTFTMEGKDFVMEPGVFIVLPAATPHSLKAEENTSFLLIFSE